MSLSPSVVRQIRRITTRAHSPLVQVHQSNIEGAGLGVFWKGLSVCEPGRILCLYPGIFSPGLPNYCFLEDSVYLAHQVTPSGLLAEDNAYVLNLQDTGGYIDAEALLLGTETASYRLDENPSACGHFVNHTTKGANVAVLSFYWKDVGIVEDSEKFYPLPNRLRCDGSPWFWCGKKSEVVRFEQIGGSCSSDHKTQVCGAALVSIQRVKPRDELLLDYGLQPPYPKWASGWYKG